MSPLETVFVWIAIGCYALISTFYFYGFIFGKERIVERLSYAITAVLAVHTAAIAARYAAIGNLPVAGDYESGLAGSWMVVFLTIIVGFRNSRLRGIGIGTIPVALVMLGYGVMREPELVPMAVSLKSSWLYIHVLFAWLAYGAYAVSFGTAIVYLLKSSATDKPLYQRFPDLPELDELMFRYLVFGFVTDAVMIASGAIWAKSLWGNYWSWDPVETWSLVSWLIYGLAVHLRVTLGWRGRRIAWILVFALAGVIISFFGINLFVRSSLHIFGAESVK